MPIRGALTIVALVSSGFVLSSCSLPTDFRNIPSLKWGAASLGKVHFQFESAKPSRKGVVDKRANTPRDEAKGCENDGHTDEGHEREGRTRI